MNKIPFSLSKNHTRGVSKALRGVQNMLRDNKSSGVVTFTFLQKRVRVILYDMIFRFRKVCENISSAEVSLCHLCKLVGVKT